MLANVGRTEQEATIQKKWSEIADAYTKILREEEKGRPTFLGSSIQTLLGRGKAFLRMAYLGKRDAFDRAIWDFSAASRIWPGRTWRWCLA